MNIYLQEKRFAENFAIIYHTNINSKQDFFPDKLHPNKKGRGILKGNFEMFINNCKFWCFLQEDDIVTQNSKIPLHPTRNTGNASSSPPLISSNHSDEKDPQSFLKDLMIKNINRFIIGQLNINSLRVISENIDILMISETKLDETFPAAQILLQSFCMSCRLDRNRIGGGIMLYIREDIPSRLVEKNVWNNIETFSLK